MGKRTERNCLGVGPWQKKLYKNVCFFGKEQAKLPWSWALAGKIIFRENGFCMRRAYKQNKTTPQTELQRGSNSVWGILFVVFKQKFIFENAIFAYGLKLSCDI